jgi:putative addiction module component (TIGR02574 family)
MDSSAAEISNQALRLPANERAALLDRLFDSIESEVDKDRRAEIEKRWAEEAERRIDAVNRGEMELLDGPATIAKHRAATKNR